MSEGPQSARIAEIRKQAEAAIAAAADTAALEELRVHYLGRKAELMAILRGIAALPPRDRGVIGKAGNQARTALEGLLEERRNELEEAEMESALATDRVDVTLPGSPPAPTGHLHLLTQTRREIEDVFIALGYRVLEGPEVEHDHYNFTALNHPPGHPARMLQDTFYVRHAASSASRPGATAPVEDEGDDVLLRTHTSPMQVRAMETHEPPIFIVLPGKVYRRDHDATHTPMFHQVEGLAVAEEITLADLKGTLLHFARAIFGGEREVRMRPHFFPFTEPSVEVDVSCFRCGGSGRMPDGSRDPLCKGVGWVEILGAGMVDPNVFGFVRESGYDPERVQGFAFGVGIERVAMLKHGLGDLRIFFDNDVRFLEQF